MSQLAPRLSDATAANLATAIRDHENFALRRQGGRRADLRFWKMKGIRLRGRRLDDIELSGADLSGGDLSESIFDRASLHCADLSYTNLSRASLVRADLRGAKVQGTIFEFADLQGSDFRQATIGYLDKHDNWKVLGGRQDISTVSFAHCSLKGAKLDGANLKDANFAGAILSGASFKGATLGEASFDGAVLLGVRLEELRVPRERLQKALLDPGRELLDALPHMALSLEQSELFVRSAGRQGRIADFSGKDIRALSSLMKGRLLTGIGLARTVGVGLDLSGCELQRAIFEGADLRDVNFKGADLRGASFRGSNLAHADFTGANLAPLVLNDGKRLSTDFTNAITASTRFDAAG